MTENERRIAVIGLGYVGLPLAVEFGKHRDVVGFDVNSRRIEELNNGLDSTREVSTEELKSAVSLQLTNDVDKIDNCSIYIVTVPTPITQDNRPDLKPLLSASKTVGKYLSKNDIVIFESTVFPGATEDDCVPILEEYSGLVYNKDFFCGYSPERINPGDKQRTLTKITKVIAASNPKTVKTVNELYSSIIDAGTYVAENIRVAEAAKVIENTQRDLNIALINELAIIFNRLGIDTQSVLNAAGTKWNFLPFRPGLVGGHCIGVDPYYLTHKAESVGYRPEIILAGRRINDGMGSYVANQLVKFMLKKKVHVPDSKVLVLGLTFKEDCPDLRNTRVVDVIKELKDFGCSVSVSDPVADPEEAYKHFGIQLTDTNEELTYDAIILAVAHKQYKSMTTSQLKQLSHSETVVYDLKSALPDELVDIRL